MTKKRTKRRLVLTVIYSLVLFFVLLLTMLVVAAACFLLIHRGFFPGLRDSTAAVTTLVIVMALASVGVGTMMGAIVSRIPLYPVNLLIDQIDRLASGDYSARVSFGKPFGHEESILELTQSFNKLAQELENTEMLRSDFINNFSHEFKTPIVSIAGFAKLLKREDLPPDQRQEYLNIIEEESLRLSAMATNVLNLTRIENQTILTDVTTFNLSEQIRSCILLLEPKWSRKEQQFQLELEEYTIRGNEELLKQVWINLVENAVKFSPRDAQIHVDIRPRETSLEVCIRNPSRELTREQLTRIFNKFYQADASHATEGNGIGLAIVQGVVRLHGGTVWVTSDQGATTFTVELPR